MTVRGSEDYRFGIPACLRLDEVRGSPQGPRWAPGRQAGKHSLTPLLAGQGDTDMMSLLAEWALFGIFAPLQIVCFLLLVALVVFLIWYRKRQT